jgi:hypothetical protein
MGNGSELLVGLSDEELEALADSLLAPSAQARLDELLERNSAHELAADEEAELDHLLARVDHLTILKTRARYTLRRREQPERERLRPRRTPATRSRPFRQLLRVLPHGGEFDGRHL